MTATLPERLQHSPARCTSISLVARTVRRRICAFRPRRWRCAKLLQQGKDAEESPSRWAWRRLQQCVDGSEQLQRSRVGARVRRLFGCAGRAHDTACRGRCCAAAAPRTLDQRRLIRGQQGFRIDPALPPLLHRTVRSPHLLLLVEPSALGRLHNQAVSACLRSACFSGRREEICRVR